MTPWRFWKVTGPGLVAAFILACNLMNVFTPYRAPPVDVQGGARWIGIEPGSNRAFLRQVITIPFTPLHAWVAVASDDYILYVNGQIAAQNQFTINAALTFQHAISDRAQGLNTDVVAMARAPDLRLGPNREWRAFIYTDVSRLLRPGTNVIAVALQTASPSVRMAIQGRISGDSASIPLDGAAEAWHVSRTPDVVRQQPWFLSRVQADGWDAAHDLGPVEERIRATAPPEIWTRPPPRTALVVPEVAGEARIARVLPGLSGDPQEAAWLRVTSSWPYTVIVGNEIAGEGNVFSRTGAFDLTRYLRHGPQRVSIRLYRSGDLSLPAPTVAVDGAVGATPIAADAGWFALLKDDPQWASGGGTWGAADAAPLRPQTRSVAFSVVPPKSWWTLQVAFGWAVCFAGLVALFLALRGLGRHAGDRTGGTAAALWILSLPMLVAASCYILRIRFKYSDAILDYVDPAQYGASLVLTAGMLVVALLTYVAVGQGTAGLPAVRPAIAIPRLTLPSSRTAWGIALAVVMLIAVVLRVYHIGIESLQADENVSLDAARGVAATGAPFETSGVLYTRSTLYHYMLAGWIALFGSAPGTARLMSVIPGVLVIPLAYDLAYRATGRRTVALACALLMAFSPWQINKSRNIRFYQQMQFFGALATCCFIRGFVQEHSKAAQNLFFVAASLAVLCQEVFVLTFPGYCIAGLPLPAPVPLARQHQRAARLRHPDDRQRARCRHLHPAVPDPQRRHHHLGRVHHSAPRHQPDRILRHLLPQPAQRAADRRT